MDAYALAHKLVGRRQTKARRLNANKRTLPSHYKEDKFTRAEAEEIANVRGMPRSEAELASLKGRSEVEGVLQDLVGLAKEQGSYVLETGEVNTNHGPISDVFPHVWAYLQAVVPIIQPSFQDEELPQPEVHSIVYDPVKRWIDDNRTIAKHINKEVEVTTEQEDLVDTCTMTVQTIEITVPLNKEQDQPASLIQRYLKAYDRQPKRARVLVHEYQHVLQDAYDGISFGIMSEDLGKKRHLSKELASMFLDIPGVSVVLSETTQEVMKRAHREQYARQPIEWDARLAEYVYRRLHGHNQHDVLQDMPWGLSPEDIPKRIAECEHRFETGSSEEQRMAKSRLKFLKAYQDDLESFLEIGESLVERVREERRDWWDNDVWLTMS